MDWIDLLHTHKKPNASRFSAVCRKRATAFERTFDKFYRLQIYFMVFMIVWRYHETFRFAAFYESWRDSIFFRSLSVETYCILSCIHSVHDWFKHLLFHQEPKESNRLWGERERWLECNQINSYNQKHISQYASFEDWLLKILTSDMNLVDWR